MKEIKAFLCWSNLMEIIRLLTKMRQNLATLCFGHMAGFRIVMSVCLPITVQENIYEM